MKRLAAVAAALSLGAAPSRYNEPSPPAPRAELVQRIDQLVVKLARDERRTEPHPDARLDDAAAEIGRNMPERGAPSNELVQGAMWLHGIVEPAPHLLVAAMDPNASGDELLRELGADLPTVLSQGRYSRVGVALVPVGGETRVIVALQESFIDLEPVARGLPNGGPARLRGRLHAGFERPEVLVTAPDGSVTRLPLLGDAQAFDGTFHCEKRGRHQIELVGEDRFGATVLANFPIYCGQPAPATLQGASPAGSTRDEPFTTTAKAEEETWRLVNVDRARAGLPSLAWDARLADVARSHSADMLAHNFFGHVSPTTGSAADRVKRAQIDAMVIQENVARAATPGEAERGLMNSPGHRANILSKDATRLGVGIVATEAGGQRELFVTQLFIKPPEPYRADTPDDVRRQIAEWRRAHKLQALGRDQELDRLADGAVREMVKHNLSAGDAGRRIDMGLDGGHWSQARSAVAVVSTAAQIVDALRGPLGDGTATDYGLGIMPGRRKDGGSAVYVIIVLATRRR